jgi:hypothetical protein
LNQVRSLQEVCLELRDHSTTHFSAVKFLGLSGSRDHAQAGRLADQFLTQNRSLFRALDVEAGSVYDGNDLHLTLRGGSSVGAIPLLSPTSARSDYGLVVTPRFPWAGIGPMMMEMGWRVSPAPLRLPLLRRSERRVPGWVLSFMILSRLQQLLNSLERRFEIIDEKRQAPRGAVRWTEYATRSLPAAGVLRIPCTFADLRHDRLLKGAVRHTIERQIRSLESQKEHGAFIHRLIEFAEQLLQRVRNVPAYLPSAAMLSSWLQRPMRSEPFLEGIQAIEWMVEERGLAGLSDLEGIPWAMSMNEFFEAWVETLFQRIARQTGATFKVGRTHQTTFPISWEPPYAGSQKALIPDLWLEWNTTTLIVDAKYKRHLEELDRHSWAGVEEQLREQHRHDLLQVLAYANLARTPDVIACLAYPCTPENWRSLVNRGRLIHRAEIPAGDRRISLWLTAVPMNGQTDAVSGPLTTAILNAIRP